MRVSKKAENLCLLPGTVVQAAITGSTMLEAVSECHEEPLTGLSGGVTFLEDHILKARGKQRDHVKDHCIDPGSED